MTTNEETKPGKYGTLYHYVVEYNRDDGLPSYWRTWAYNLEHALEKFYDDPGEWTALRVGRQTRKGKRSVNWYSV